MRWLICDCEHSASDIDMPPPARRFQISCADERHATSRGFDAVVIGRAFPRFARTIDCGFRNDAKAFVGPSLDGDGGDDVWSDHNGQTIKVGAP